MSFLEKIKFFMPRLSNNNAEINPSVISMDKACIITRKVPRI